MKKPEIHLSWRYNGFGFALVWIGSLYVQFGTIKLIIYKKHIFDDPPLPPPEIPKSWETFLNLFEDGDNK